LKRRPLDGVMVMVHNTDPQSPPPPLIPEEDTSAAIGVRLGGCLIGFLLFVVLLSLPDILQLTPPPLVTSLIGVVLGVACVMLYSMIARRRWGVSAPDVVQMVGRDLGSIRRKELRDYRLRFGKGWSWRERALHELLYAVKWLGHLLIFAGLGSAMYRLMVRLGITQ
jgi:hypothetical protein